MKNQYKNYISLNITDGREYFKMKKSKRPLHIRHSPFILTYQQLESDLEKYYLRFCCSTFFNLAKYLIRSFVISMTQTWPISELRICFTSPLKLDICGEEIFIPIFIVAHDFVVQEIAFLLDDLL